MKLRNLIAAGIVSVSAAVLASPASAAPQAAKADKCSLHVSIAHPRAGQTETLAVTSSAAGTTVRVRISYKTVYHLWTFKTPVSTKVTYGFGVGRPTPGYKVTLAGTVIAVPEGYGAGATCSAGFIPE